VGSELGRKLYGWAFKVHDKYFTPCHLAHHTPIPCLKMPKVFTQLKKNTKTQQSIRGSPKDWRRGTIYETKGLAIILPLNSQLPMEVRGN